MRDPLRVCVKRIPFHSGADERSIVTTCGSISNNNFFDADGMPENRSRMAFKGC